MILQRYFALSSRSARRFMPRSRAAFGGGGVVSALVARTAGATGAERIGSRREVGRPRRGRGEVAKKKFELLRALAAEPTRVYTKQELLRDVWGFRSMGRKRR
jgi:DNA-binding response OmpR family regulator